MGTFGSKQPRAQACFLVTRNHLHKTCLDQSANFALAKFLAQQDDLIIWHMFKTNSQRVHTKSVAKMSKLHGLIIVVLFNTLLVSVPC